MSPDNLCRACKKKQETVSHIFLECPKYSVQRKTHFDSALKYRLDATLSNFLIHTRMKTSTEVFIQHTLVCK